MSIFLSAPNCSFSDTLSETLENSSSSSYTLGSSSSTSPTASDIPRDIPLRNKKPDNDLYHANVAKKRGRKGHTKSRKGCFNCKRARIKCKENRPSCDYCAHRNLVCEWPDMVLQEMYPGNGANQETRQLGTTIRKADYPVHTERLPLPMMFDMPKGIPHRYAVEFTGQDFRLFHHFIEAAHPHHPIGNDWVWTHEIPVIAADHDYLLHSMLALGASDLAVESPDPLSPEAKTQLSTTALSHRVQAISCLNAAILRGINRFEDGNAMLATCYALLFQSVFLEDGLAEYMSFIRGTVAVGMQMGMKGMKVLFDQLFEDKDLKVIEPAMLKAPLIDSGLVRLALESLERIEPLCQTKVEREMYGMLLSTARALITSSHDAFMNLRKIYAAFSFFMPQSEFNLLTDPTQTVLQCLQAHFVALQMTMTPITRNEWVDRDTPKAKRRGSDGQTKGWFRKLHRGFPEEMRRYYAWTLWVEREVGEGRVVSGVVDRASVEEMLNDRDMPA